MKMLWVREYRKGFIPSETIQERERIHTSKKKTNERIRLDGQKDYLRFTCYWNMWIFSSLLFLLSSKYRKGRLKWERGNLFEVIKHRHHGIISAIFQVIPWGSIRLFPVLLFSFLLFWRINVFSFNSIYRRRNQVTSLCFNYLIDISDINNI